MDADERTSLGVEIRQRRKHLKLDQRDVAEKAGVSERTVRSLEAGKQVSPGTLGQVLSALDMRPQKPAWPEDIQTFLDMIGFRLSRLEGEQRTRLMFEVTRAIVDGR